MEGSTAIDFAQILTWVTSLTTSMTTMFNSLSSMWVLFVPLILGIFGFVFAKVKGLTWNRSGRRRRG